MGVAGANRVAHAIDPLIEPDRSFAPLSAKPRRAVEMFSRIALVVSRCRSTIADRVRSSSAFSALRAETTAWRFVERFDVLRLG